LASANLPRSQEQAIRNLAATQVLQTQFLVSLFESSHWLIGVAFPKQRLGDIGSAFDPGKFIHCPRVSADNYQEKQDHSDLEHSEILVQSTVCHLRWKLLLNSTTASL
jgi:hypothetical protein